MRVGIMSQRRCRSDVTCNTAVTQAMQHGSNGWFASKYPKTCVSSLMIHVAPAKQMGSSVPVLAISAAILGLMAGIFLTVSGSLILPIVVHIEFNLVGFILGTRK